MSTSSSVGNSWLTSSVDSSLEEISDYEDYEIYKSSILSALYLGIGSWTFVPKTEGELVAKFHFFYKKLAWEILSDECREKIEIDSSTIMGIKATMEENEPGTLELELSEPPKFYIEHDPEPRKHIRFVDGSDFTEGQALKCRRHLIKFAAGVLDQHFEKLLSRDEHLFELSNRPFPTSNIPSFDDDQ